MRPSEKKMTVNSETLVKFFTKVINQDGETLQLISQQNDQIKFIDGVLVFTLTALHKILALGDGSYKQFRSMVYASKLNQELLKIDYTVSIYDSTNKIDSTWYQLQPMDRSAIV